MGLRERHVTALNFVLFVSVVCNIYFLTFSTNDPTVISYLHKEFEIDWLNSNVTIIDPYQLESLNQKDPKLINYIRARHLIPPSKLQYNFTGNGKRRTYKKNFLFGGDTSTEAEIKNVFGNKTGGYFVECGGYDGRHSETIFLELNYGWSGLLIECNPILVQEIIQVHRKIYVADVCLSVTDHPKMTEISSMDEWPASSSTLNGPNIFPTFINSTFTRFVVQSIPFYSLIAATRVREVDVIVLDVQGIELSVLKHFPFNLIHVKMWIIEVVLFNAKDKAAVKMIMRRNGYQNAKPSGPDYIFVHKSVTTGNV